jgi:hypothetical protein
MHLLKTDTYKIIYVSGKTPQYAILSHRWEPEEITFRTFNSQALQDASLRSFDDRLRPSAVKIQRACAKARQQGFDYIWIDTCCIDKSSSEELRTALNSMYKWYREAAVCYTFLNDVAFSRIGDNMFDSYRKDRQGKSSEWFERGWTLQELLVPQKMEFYDTHWTFMGTRNELADLVSRVAGIRPEYLNGQLSFRKASIATKMSWMAGRTTREVEDIAYSLLGIFNVNLTPQYGEGVKAFSRLQDAIMLDYGAFDESLFAWVWPHDGQLKCYRDGGRVPRVTNSKWGLLAPSPDCFKNASNIVIDQHKLRQRLAGGFIKTSQGISFTVGYGEGKNMFGLNRSKISVPLNCWRLQNGQSLETIVIELSRDARRGWSRLQCNELSSSKWAKVGNNRVLGFDQGAIGSATITVMQPHIDLQ